MKVLRVSIFIAAGVPPMTYVMRERDLAVPMEEVMTVFPPNQFVIYDSFEMEDGEIYDATAEAARRQQERAQDEDNMAMLYYYDVAAFPSMRDGGTIAGTVPAPLSVEQIGQVFEQLSQHEGYRDFRLTILSTDLRVVTYSDGEIEVAGVE